MKKHPLKPMKLATDTCKRHDPIGHDQDVIDVILMLVFW